MGKPTDLPITPEDMQTIESLVASFRNSLQTTYQLAYMQGQIDAKNAAMANLRSGVSPFAERRSDPRHDLTVTGSPLVPGQ